ncbi:UNVERIFIED_CONTAM: hypothetical protein Sradi_4375700 [Sesamum radiatum]|uniref:Uncharacterized protein n=1 Tax=Sesamum radiatum TaxID=300843 RepID=A0AAW2NS98_SESRA
MRDVGVRKNAPVKGVIYTIVEGPRGGNSKRMRKKYERYTRSDRRKELILNVEPEEEITFGHKDLGAEARSQKNPMVIRMAIANFSIHKVLVDNSSSADIIFKEVLRKMGLEDTVLNLVQTPLVGFGGSEVTSLGTIDLPVSIGEELKRKTIMIRFFVVDNPFAYNVILGRPGLNLFRAVVSTYHLEIIKFPTKNGIGGYLAIKKRFGGITTCP